MNAALSIGLHRGQAATRPRRPGKHLLPMIWILAFSLASLAHAGGVSEVSVTVKGGRLLVTADDGPSSVVVRATGQADTFEVRPLNGANVNGGAGGEFSGVTRGMRVDLGEGANELLVSSGHAAPFAVLAALSVRSGGGDDVVVLDRVFIDKLVMSTGAGADTFYAFVCGLIGAAKLATDDGDDVVVLDNCETGKAKANLGSGADRVALFDSVLSGKSSFALGPDHDRVGITASFFDVLRVTGSTGFDVLVRMDDVATPSLRQVEEQIAFDPEVVEQNLLIEGRVQRAIELIENEGSSSP
jgi:hypothetical protein